MLHTKFGNDCFSGEVPPSMNYALTIDYVFLSQTLQPPKRKFSTGIEDSGMLRMLRAIALNKGKVLL